MCAKVRHDALWVQQRMGVPNVGQLDEKLGAELCNNVGCCV